MKKVAIYVRVSTLEQAEHGYSLTEQVDKLKQYCSIKDWNVYDVFKDGGYSGANIDRPALERLISQAKRKQFDTVLVYKLDRLSRSQKDTLYLIEDIFTANDVDFVSLSESFDTSNSFGKAIIGILSVFAQLEREQIKERMLSGKLGRAKAGLPMSWANQPFGYDYVDGRYVINPLEAKIVKEMFDYYNKRHSVTALRNKLNDEGFIGKDIKWSYKTVKQVLENKVYIGKIKYLDNYYDGVHEPIITEDVFYKAEKMMKYMRNKSTNKQPFKTKYMLSGGIAKCGYCGAPMRLDFGIRVNGTKTYRYSCRNRSKGRANGNPIYNDSKVCSHKEYYYMQNIEEYVLGEIERIQINVDEIIENSKESDDNQLLEEYLDRIDDLKRQRKKLVDLYLASLISAEEMDKRAKNFELEITQLESKIETIDEPSYPILEYLKNQDFDIRKIHYNQQKEIVRLLIDKVSITPDDIKIYWNF